MNNKRVIVLAMAAFVGQAYGVDYVVTGKAPGFDGKKIYMTDYNTQSDIDSTMVVDGSFRFEGSYDSNAFVRIHTAREYANCVLEDDTIVVDLGTHIPAPGLKLNNVYLEYENLDKKLFEEAEQFRNSLMAKNLSGKELEEEYKRSFLDVKESEYRAKVLDLILTQDNGVGVAAPMSYNYMMSPDEWFSIYPKLGPYLKNSELSKRLNKKFESISASEVGKPFIDFTAKNPDGTPAKLSDYVGKGKYVLVDFWASWCGPCRVEAKEILIPLYERYKDDERFTILGVAVWDDPEKTKESIKRYDYKWPQLIDAGMTPMNLYGFDGIPMIILFDPEGKIVARELRGAQLTDTVEKVLK